MSDIRELVRDYRPGVKITEPGIYRGVPMDAYHGDLCDGPSVSKSVLWTGESRSFKHAFRDWYGNPKRVQKDVPHYTLGRAIHHLAAGELEFGQNFVVRPAKWDSWRTNDAKAWRAEQILLGFGVLAPEDLDAIRGVADSLNDHPTIQAGILKGLVEHSIVWRDPETGIWVKSRPDVIPVDGQMVADLKTCADASRPACVQAISKFGYHMQMAICDEGLREVCGWTAQEHVLVFVEKSDPWVINHKPVDGWALDYGRRQFRRSIRRFAECVASGVWTGYDDDEIACGISDGLARKLAAESENGLLPRIGGETDEAGWTPPTQPSAAEEEDEDEEEAV